MKRYTHALAIVILLLLSGYQIAHSQTLEANHELTTLDSLITVETLENSSVPLFEPNSIAYIHQPDNYSRMPIYNPKGIDAKILYWWPEGDYHYGMPNLLENKADKKG